jgi:hypothetical protein
LVKKNKKSPQKSGQKRRSKNDHRKISGRSRKAAFAKEEPERYDAYLKQPKQSP